MTEIFIMIILLNIFTFTVRSLSVSIQVLYSILAVHVLIFIGIVSLRNRKSFLITLFGLIIIITSYIVVITQRLKEEKKEQYCPKRYNAAGIEYVGDRYIKSCPALLLPF